MRNIMTVAAFAALAGTALAQNFVVSLDTDRVEVDPDNPTATISLRVQVEDVAPDEFFGLSRVAGNVTSQSNNGPVNATFARDQLTLDETYGNFDPDGNPAGTGMLYPFRGIFNNGLPPGHNDNSPFNGTVQAEGIGGIDGIQNPFVVVEEDAGFGSPALVYRFTFTPNAFNARRVTINFDGTGNYFIEEEDGNYNPSDSFDITARVVIDVVPAPATAGLLAMGGIAATRRRR